jgi:hypothetical protein
MGYLDEFSRFDNVTMVASVLIALDGVIPVGTNAPNRDALFTRLNAIDLS